MKLYYCSECDKYHRRARVKIEWFGTFDLSSRMLMRVDEPSYGEDDGVVLLSSPKCPGCELNMSVVELDVCPHDWEPLWERQNIFRHCHLCDVVQEGQAVFK